VRRIDYDIGWSSGNVTITARSDRAKLRTPNPLLLEREAALKLVERDEAEGFTFLGHHYVDRTKSLVKNGYFVIGPSGQLIPAGQDWGPSEPIYEQVDTLMGGPRNGKEATIEKILSGDAARELGFGLVFVVRERDVSTVN
jgi:hypothetical protein